MRAAVRRRVGTVARVLPGARRAYRDVQARRSMQKIRASGLFDRAWYESQMGRAFPSHRAALRHYVAVGRKAGLSPCLLFEPSWYEPAKWRTRVGDPLARYLFRPEHMRQRSPHILFDPARYLADHPAAPTHPGGPIGDFLAGATPERVLDLEQVLGRPARVTWGEAVERMRATTAQWGTQEGLRRAKRQSTAFDPADERRYRADLAQVPDPVDATGGPVVSVVMPVWNRSAQVRRAVSSVQEQTLTAWELVVVDDGSSDDTPYVLEGLAAFDPRIRVIRAARSGVSKARNTAVEAARGRYVAFLDSDNTWEPDFLRLMLRAMEARSLAVAYSAMEVHQGDRVTYRAFEGDREHLLLGNHVDLNVLVARTDLVRAVGGFSEDLRRTVDYDLVLKLSEREELTYLPFIGAQYAEDAEDADRISVREPVSWDYVVRSRHAVDWAGAESAQRVLGRLSVIVPVRNDAHAARRCVRALLGDPDGRLAGAPVTGAGTDLEVVVLDRASGRGASIAMSLLPFADPRVRWHRTAVDVGYALGVDTALPLVTGEFVAVCEPTATVRAGWAPPLLAALREPGVACVQPLATGADGTVTGAGATIAVGGGVPAPLLVGHPPEDVRGLGDVVEVPVPHGPMWLARTADVVAVRGPECLLSESWHAADLALRLRSYGGARVVAGSRVDQLAGPALSADPRPNQDDAIFRDRWQGALTAEGAELWERAGFQVAHHRVERDEDEGRRLLVPVVVRNPRVVADGPAVGLPALRWAIKTAAPTGPRGQTWGDWHFAESLAAALRALGQDVVIDSRDAVHRPTSYLEDVNLVLRGLDHVEPDEGRTNLLWVISHPELVEPAQLAGYDAVFAASDRWAAAAGARWGVDVQPLLQCTDSGRFTPSAGVPDSGAAVLFVGNSRGVYRPVVRHAVEADVPLTVYGDGWGAFLPPSAVAGTALPNARVAVEYATAGVVLNDHWEDMRREGFISNRVFDVVATGGRLISDDVPGLTELLGPASVRTWRGAEELADLLRAPVEELFGSRDERLEAAAVVAREHSFAARARQLLESVVKRLDQG